MASSTRHIRREVLSKKFQAREQESSTAEEEESDHSSHGVTDMTSREASDESYRVPSHRVDPDSSSQSESGPSSTPKILYTSLQFRAKSFQCFAAPMSAWVINIHISPMDVDAEMRDPTSKVKGGVTRLKTHYTWIGSKGKDSCKAVTEELWAAHGGDRARYVSIMGQLQGPIGDDSLLAIVQEDRAKLPSQRSLPGLPMSTTMQGGASASNNPRPNLPCMEASSVNVSTNTEMPTQASVAPSASTTQQAPIPSATMEEHVGASSKKRTRGGTRPSTLQEAWAPSLKKKAEIAEERFFYQCNIAFNVARTGAYKRFVHDVSAAAAAGAPITPAGSEALRTTRLTRQVDMVHDMLDGHRQSWTLYGCTIISDGWKYIRKRHLLNILVSCCTGTTFLQAIDVSLLGLRLQAIEEVRPQNVVQVVTDNVSNQIWIYLYRAMQVRINQRIFRDNGAIQNRLEEDLLEYRGNRGNFSRLIAKDADNQALPISWWKKFGGFNPTLQSLALRVLSQEVSSSGAERLWSIMGDVHTKDRNRLNTPQLDKLAYVNANLCVLKKVGALEDVGVVSWLPRQLDHRVIKVDAADVSSLQPHTAEDDAYDFIREDMMRFSRQTRSTTCRLRGVTDATIVSSRPSRGRGRARRRRGRVAGPSIVQRLTPTPSECESEASDASDASLT
ncbi:hypothetical protein L7F22_033403 [Adiantum nelumboides]|nr:hypothetical protein [Adiantum nelumboides]